MLELIVKVININLPANHPILTQCRPLYEYSWFIQAIKNYMACGKNRDEAIIQAIADCEHEGILVDFLREHRTEAVNMLFTEFNMEDALEVRFAEGKAEGKAEDILELLAEAGEVPEELKRRIASEEDMGVLKRWLKLAAKAETVEAFESDM